MPAHAAYMCATPGFEMIPPQVDDLVKGRAERYLDCAFVLIAAGVGCHSDAMHTISRIVELSSRTTQVCTRGPLGPAHIVVMAPRRKQIIKRKIGKVVKSHPK